MKPIGLTGNIGCGKSTVASILSKYPDVAILDCDFIAKDIITNGACAEKINEILAVNVFTGEKVDFGKIAKIVFHDPKKKKKFERLIHPLVWKIMREKAEAAGDRKICIVESAIIYETKSEDKFSAIIVAACTHTEQIRRLRENRGMNEDQIQARLAYQYASPEKEMRAHFVIHTDCGMKELAKKVKDLYHILKRMKGGLHEKKKSGVCGKP